MMDVLGLSCSWEGLSYDGNLGKICFDVTIQWTRKALSYECPAKESLRGATTLIANARSRRK